MADGRWLFHLAIFEDWDGALATGEYRQSTLDRSLAQEGFIHCSFANQVPMVAEFLYSGRQDVVLLRIDRPKVTHEIRVENLDGGEHLFPHIYGPLSVDAVVRADRIPVDASGHFALESLLSD